MINKLREETEELHREIEKNNLASLILSHTIQPAEYKLLLLQNFVAYSITEKQIAPYLENFNVKKSEQLKFDLDALEVDYSLYRDYEKLYAIANKAEALGAAYVVEGSAMGGMLISKELQHCTALQNISTHYFFNGDRSSIKDWRNFTSALKKEQLTALEQLNAIDKAKETFEFFGRVFRDLNSLPD